MSLSSRLSLSVLHGPFGLLTFTFFLFQRNFNNKNTTTSYAEPSLTIYFLTFLFLFLSLTLFLLLTLSPPLIRFCVFYFFLLLIPLDLCFRSGFAFFYFFFLIQILCQKKQLWEGDNILYVKVSSFDLGLGGGFLIYKFLSQNSILMKKVAGSSHHQPNMVDEEASARFKQQRLLQEYLEVQKEFVSKKKKLQIAKQKREILLAEVRFLRQRHNHLKKQTPELETEENLVGPLNSHSQSKLLAENRSFGVSENVVKNSPPILNLNQNLGDEDCYRGRKEEVVLDSLRVKKKRKNWMINEKRVGKKKISWQDQVALRV